MLSSKKVDIFKKMFIKISKNARAPKTADWLRRLSLQKKNTCVCKCFLVSGSDISSQAVSSQVLSARRGLTTVFGMRTGGTLAPLPPEWLNAL